MAYYTALQNEWTTLTGSGTFTTSGQAALIPGYLATLDALMVSGSIPSIARFTADQIFNCLSYTEFNQLSAANKSLIQAILTIHGSLAGGSSSSFLWPMFSGMYSGALASGTTITALLALVSGTPVPWYQSNGYPAPININDLISAGIVTYALAHQVGIV